MIPENENEIKNKILIIDDSRLFLSFISQVLKQEQFIDFQLLNDPRLALEKALEYKPDIILTDLEMPHLSGIDLLRILTKEPLLKSTPIIMLSSSDAEKNLVMAIENGAHDFLNKNLNPKLIMTKIVHLLKHRKILDQDSKMKQLALLNQFIILANHEFNNALFISNGSIKRMRKKALSEDEINGLLKIEEMNNRMMVLIKKFEKLKNIDIENFEQEIKFLDIDY